MTETTAATAGHEHEDHTRGYLIVFGALMALTLVTVAISYLHLPKPYAIAIALLIASIKGSLVVAFFMHMISEKTILRSILVTALLGLFFLIMLPWMDIGHSFGSQSQPMPEGLNEGHPEAAAEVPHVP